MTHHILLIDDEHRLLRILSLFLADQGFKVTTAEDGQKAIDLLKTMTPDIVVSDLKMEPIDGMAVLKFCRLNCPDLPFILLTAFGSVETAVSAMKYGAFDFMTKPVDHNALLEVIKQALAVRPKETAALDALVGSSAQMEKIKKDIQLFASTDSSVMITGESGTGKELAARAIHQASTRAAGPFVKVNCAAIPRELIESELFGHKKGAFTGALRDRIGAFRKADNGVIFLDEIGDLPTEMQPKMLHAVEEKTITPIGSGKEIPVSVKILSATNRDLSAMIKDLRFRSDLYYRLNTVNLSLPALRHKKEDIEELTLFFIDEYCRRFKKPLLTVSNRVMDALVQYAWPGNVRELKNLMERAAIICDKDMIDFNHLPDHIRESGHHPSDTIPEQTGMDLAVQEQKLLFAALEKHGWHQSRTAQELGITRSALRYRLQKYGIQRP